MCAKLLQSFPILCDPVDCSPPGSSVHGILQAKILEWGHALLCLEHMLHQIHYHFSNKMYESAYEMG